MAHVPDRLEQDNSMLSSTVEELQLEISYYQGETKRLELEKSVLIKDLSKMSNMFQNSVHDKHVNAVKSSALNKKMKKHQDQTIADVLQLSDDVILLTSCQAPFFIEYASKAWSNECGWNSSEILGLTCAFLQGEVTDPATTRNFMEEIRERGHASMRVNNYRRNGEAFSVTVTVSSIYDTMCSVGPGAEIPVLTHFASRISDLVSIPNPTSSTPFPPPPPSSSLSSTRITFADSEKEMKNLSDLKLNANIDANIADIAAKRPTVQMVDQIENAAVTSIPKESTVSNANAGPPVGRLSTGSLSNGGYCSGVSGNEVPRTTRRRYTTTTRRSNDGSVKARQHEVEIVGRDGQKEEEEEEEEEEENEAEEKDDGMPTGDADKCSNYYEYIAKICSRPKHFPYNARNSNTSGDRSNMPMHVQSAKGSSRNNTSAGSAARGHVGGGDVFPTTTVAVSGSKQPPPPAAAAPPVSGSASGGGQITHIGGAGGVDASSSIDGVGDESTSRSSRHGSSSSSSGGEEEEEEEMEMEEEVSGKKGASVTGSGSGSGDSAGEMAGDGTKVSMSSLTNPSGLSAKSAGSGLDAMDSTSPTGTSSDVEEQVFFATAPPPPPPPLPLPLPRAEVVRATTSTDAVDAGAANVVRNQNSSRSSKHNSDKITGSHGAEMEGVTTLSSSSSITKLPYDRRRQAQKFEPRGTTSAETFFKYGESLRLSNLLRLMLSSRNAMVLTDKIGRILHTNTAWSKLTGYELTDVEGRTCKLLQGPATDQIRVENFDFLTRNFRPALMEVMNYRKDGTQFRAGITSVPIRGGYLNNDVTHYCGLLLEIAPPSVTPFLHLRSPVAHKTSVLKRKRGSNSTTVAGLQGPGVTTAATCTLATTPAVVAAETNDHAIIEKEAAAGEAEVKGEEEEDDEIYTSAAALKKSIALRSRIKKESTAMKGKQRHPSNGGGGGDGERKKGKSQHHRGNGNTRNNTNSNDNSKSRSANDEDAISELSESGSAGSGSGNDNATASAGAIAGTATAPAADTAATAAATAAAAAAAAAAASAVAVLDNARNSSSDSDGSRSSCGINAPASTEHQLDEENHHSRLASKDEDSNGRTSSRQNNCCAKRQSLEGVNANSNGNSNSGMNYCNRQFRQRVHQGSTVLDNVAQRMVDVASEQTANAGSGVAGIGRQTSAKRHHKRKRNCD